MGTIRSHPAPENDPSAPGIPSSEEFRPDLELTLDLSGKVVFITVQGNREVSKVSAEYLQADTKLAVLDVSQWALHILSARPGGSPIEPISCGSWVAAAEAAIAHLGPVNLWMDTRDTTFPPISRVGTSR